MKMKKKMRRLKCQRCHSFFEKGFNKERGMCCKCIDVVNWTRHTAPCHVK